MPPRACQAPPWPPVTVTRPMSVPHRRHPHRACPSCSGRAVRVRRQPADGAAAPAGTARRYRCLAAGCGWAGLVAVAPPPVLRALAGKIVRKTAAAVLVVVGLAASAVLLVAQADAGWPTSTQRPVAVGQSDDGEPLPTAHPTTPDRAASASAPASAALSGFDNPPPLALRQGCAWGKPGRNPYQGTVEQALTAANLPAGLVGLLADKIRRRDPTDRLLISRAAIRTVGSQREFSPNGFAMAFGHTMCRQSRVNFEPGHVEQADFYEVADAAGHKVAVMVPDVCGNVSVLSAGAERGPVRRLLARPVALLQGAWGDAADGPALASALGAAGPAHPVPEPGTLVCVIAALAALLAVNRLRRRRRR